MKIVKGIEERICPFCKEKKMRVIESKKRLSKGKRNSFPGYRLICFKCWSSTKKFFTLMELIRFYKICNGTF